MVITTKLRSQLEFDVYQVWLLRTNKYTFSFEMKFTRLEEHYLRKHTHTHIHTHTYTQNIIFAN